MAGALLRARLALRGGAVDAWTWRGAAWAAARKGQGGQQGCVDVKAVCGAGAGGGWVKGVEGRLPLCGGAVDVWPEKGGSWGRAK